MLMMISCVSVLAALGAHVVRRITRAYPNDAVVHALAEHRMFYTASRTY